MEPIKQVIKFENALRLRDLGFKKPSLFHYVPIVGGSYQVEMMFSLKCGLKDSYSAYTLAELGAFLNSEVIQFEVKAIADNMFDVDFWAETLIYLIETKNIKL